MDIFKLHLSHDKENLFEYKKTGNERVYVINFNEFQYFLRLLILINTLKT